MVKKKAGQEGRVNKTQLVREYLNQQPNAMPKEVSEALKEQGVEISPQIVSQIKYQLRLVGGCGRSGLGRGGVDSLSADDLLKVKELSDAIGGPQNVERALEILKKLG